MTIFHDSSNDVFHVYLFGYFHQEPSAKQISAAQSARKLVPSESKLTIRLATLPVPLPTW